jgi:ribosomal protein S18 acetylase RimI-like enzyme
MQTSIRGAVAAVFVSTLIAGLSSGCTPKAEIAPEEQRGRGLGSKLFDTAVQMAQEFTGLHQIQLTVMAHNDHALRLYQSRGFEIFGREKAAMIAHGRAYDELHLQLLF